MVDDVVDTVRRLVVGVDDLGVEVEHHCGRHELLYDLDSAVETGERAVLGLERRSDSAVLGELRRGVRLSLDDMVAEDLGYDLAEDLLAPLLLVIVVVTALLEQRRVRVEQSRNGSQRRALLKLGEERVVVVVMIVVVMMVMRESGRRLQRIVIGRLKSVPRSSIGCATHKEGEVELGVVKLVLDVRKLRSASG